MNGKNFHLRLDIKGALLRTDKEMIGVYQRDDGQTLTPQEARLMLMDELAQGRLFLPVGECDNFDFNNGCLGHESIEVKN